MQPNIHPSWATVFETEQSKDYFKKLMLQVDEEYSNFTCFPPKDLLLTNLHLKI